MLRVVAEAAGEVVAGAGGHDREPPAGVGRDARDLGDQAVAAAGDEVVTVVGRGPRELRGRAGLGGDVQRDPGRARGALEIGQQLLRPAPSGHRVDDRRPRHGRKLPGRRG